MLSIEKNVKHFKDDLKDESLSDEYIIRKYLCNGSSPILDEETMFQIKHKISEHFRIHPNEIIITGSGKLGFSIVPTKKYRYFNENSDIDVAIISEKLFNEMWMDLLKFNINQTSRNDYEDKLYKEFRKYFFRGWIRPDKFPFKYKKKSEWFCFFRDLAKDFYSYGEHNISAGIFRNFTTFEIYNVQNLELLRTIELEDKDG